MDGAQWISTVHIRWEFQMMVDPDRPSVGHLDLMKFAVGSAEVGTKGPNCKCLKMS